jgi:hypothetical protein
MEGYDTLVRLVRLFAKNQEFHDDPDDKVSLPEKTAWNIAKKKPLFLEPGDTLYQSTDYTGNWFVRNPQPDGKYRKFRVLDNVRLEMLVLGDRRCDTLLRTEDVKQRICNSAKGLLVKRPMAEQLDEIYICGDTHSVVSPALSQMYFLDVTGGDITQCLFCDSAKMLLDRRDRPYQINRMITSEDQRSELARELGKDKILFPVVYYVDSYDEQADTMPKPTPDDYIGGYEELLMHIKSH